LTGHEDEQLAVQAVREGAQDYLIKGRLPGDVLIRTLRHAIERNHIQEKLKESERMFKLISENAGDMIAVVDRFGNRTYASPSYETVLGYSAKELIGTPALDLVHPDDRAFVKQARQHAILEGSSESIHRMRHKDGTWRFVEAKRSTIRNANGEMEQLVIVNRDVTERKLLEEQFMQSQKMEAIGRLTGGIAHDFNNLLGVIIGYAEFQQEKLEQENPLRRSAGEILKAGKRAASLTMQLLAFSRQQVLDPKVIDLNAIVTDIETLLRRAIGEDIELEISLDQRLGLVKADQGQIEQILMNLAINSRHAMPNGGKLGIRTENIELDDVLVRHRFRVQPGPCVCLTVTDNGTGMDEATKARCFEPFFTTKAKDKGTGLGLSTVYGVVKQSGGYIDVESWPGEGTTFRIFLPRTSASVAVNDREEPKSNTFLRGSGTILLVEDEAAMGTLIRDALQACGYAVLEAKDGEIALKMSREHQGTIDVLLTDVIMPGIGGKALATQLLRERPDIRVVYMSGYAGNSYKEQWPTEPGSLFLAKPFTQRDLRQKVVEALESCATTAVAEK
jgi:PAS domain S-box-containing protein